MKKPQPIKPDNPRAGAQRYAFATHSGDNAAAPREGVLRRTEPGDPDPAVQTSALEPTPAAPPTKKGKE
jgi:hypothetical protein